VVHSELRDADLNGMPVWLAVGRFSTRIEKPKTTLCVQLFNHQTPTIGSVHAMCDGSGLQNPSP